MRRPRSPVTSSSATSSCCTTTTRSPSRTTRRSRSARTSRSGTRPTAGTSRTSTGPTAARATRRTSGHSSTPTRPRRPRPGGPASSTCARSSPGPPRTPRTPASAHGSALGAEEVAATKELLGFDPEQHFAVADDVLTHTARRSSAAKPSSRSGRSGTTPGPPRPGSASGSTTGCAPAPCRTDGQTSCRRSTRTRRAWPPARHPGRCWVPSPRTSLTVGRPTSPSRTHHAEGEPSFAPPSTPRSCGPPTGSAACCTSASASTRWARSSTASRCMVAPAPTAARSSSSPTTCAPRFGRGREAAGHLCLDARLDRARRGRPDAPAHRAPRGPPGDSRSRRGPPRRRQRDSGGMEGGAGSNGPACRPRLTRTERRRSRAASTVSLTPRGSRAARTRCSTSRVAPRMSSSSAPDRSSSSPSPPGSSWPPTASGRGSSRCPAASGSRSRTRPIATR